ncbi:MAG: L-histidine N(alpha)-methyltransferase, partial [Thermoanaerobaculia bacterium]
PEYYPTRSERRILERHAGEIVRTSGASELVELGSGAATKTRLLLDAMADQGCLDLYVPFDVSEAMVAEVARGFTTLYPGLRVHGLVGDFLAHLGEIPAGGRRLAAFLGGTIGNLRPPEAAAFLERLAARLDPGDWFLLGTDLIKDPAVIEAAYNDSAGVTAEFNRNILRVLNRVAGGDFDPEGFRHRAFYDRELHRIEMRLVAERAHRVRLEELALELELAAGEELLTEVSVKYDRAGARELLAEAGFELTGWYTDPDGLFGLSLARRL